mgnify:CR=1 FL=1
MAIDSDKMTIKEILLNIDARISHIEDITADNRAIIVKLVKQGNSIVKFLKELEIEASNNVEIEYDSLDNLSITNSFNLDERKKDMKHIKELIDEFMDKREELKDLEEELNKNKEDITPGQIGEA